MDGRFVLEAESTEPTELVVAKTGFLTSRVLLPDVVVNPLQVLLAPALSRIRVVDAQTAEAIPRALIVLQTPEEDVTAETTTVADGFAELSLPEVTFDHRSEDTAIRPAWYSIRATAKGYEATSIRYSISPWEEPPSVLEHNHAVVLLQRRIEGKAVVQDEDGNPVPGARVSIWCATGQAGKAPSIDVFEELSDETGGFTWHAPKGTTKCSVMADADELRLGFLSLDGPALTEVTQPIVTVRPTHEFVGRVLAPMAALRMILRSNSGRRRAL